MMKFSLEDARKTAINCAKQYSEHLLDQKLIVIFRDRVTNSISWIEILFLDRNYQHLTGIELINDAGQVIEHQSENFFRKCIDKKLSKKEIAFKKDGTTPLKLAALPSLTRLHSITKIAGDYNGRKPYLYVNKVVGGVNFCMGLIKENNYFVPASALLEDIKKVALNPSQVLAILSKSKEKLTYDKIRYVAKGVNLINLKIPAELLTIIDLSNYIPKA